MKTRRLRLVRPRWTLGTMLLIVGWSSLVLWLNVRPRVHEVEASPVVKVVGNHVDSGKPMRRYLVEYGCPWRHTLAFWDTEESQDASDGSTSGWITG